jgi:large subunit ribosomal protein L18
MIERHKDKTTKRKLRVRGKITGTTQRPRLSVHRSTKHISAQIIDDQKQITLVAGTSLTLTQKEKLTKTQQAQQVGEKIAKKALLKKIKQIVFDRGAYQYHGRVKALAEALRKGGLKF